MWVLCHALFYKIANSIVVGYNLLNTSAWYSINTGARRNITPLVREEKMLLLRSKIFENKKKNLAKGYSREKVNLEQQIFLLTTENLRKVVKVIH